MYIVSSISPLEWHKASNCDHKDENEDSCCKGHEIENNMIFCSNTNSLYSLNENDDEYGKIPQDDHKRVQHSHSELDNNQSCEIDAKEKNIIMYNENFEQNCCGCENFLDPQADNNVQNIELISYENNFNLRNSFWWAIATLIQQTTSDLYPKVL